MWLFPIKDQKNAFLRNYLKSTGGGRFMKRAWHEILPSFLSVYVVGRPQIQKAVANTGWFFLEKAFRLCIGLFVSIMIARYLGPRDYGILSYVISLVSILGIFVYLGLSGIVTRDLVKHPARNSALMGTTFLLKFLSGVVTLIGVMVFAFSSKQHNPTESAILIIIGFTLLFKPFETIEFWFHSQVQSKFSIYAKNAAFLFASILKLILVFANGKLVAFATISLLEVLISSVLLLIFYKKKGYSIWKWKFELDQAKSLLSRSWLLILSGFMAMIYLRIDQVMLRWMIGTKEVGIYSVAVGFSEVWYFIPAAISLSIFPMLIEQKKIDGSRYNRSLQKAYDILFSLALLIALPVSFFAHDIIGFFYGEAYSESGTILAVHAWSSIFIYLRALFSRWIIIEDLLQYSLYTQGTGALINVLLNLLLITKYGGVGAAIATLISYSFASYFALFLGKKTRSVGKMMSVAILLPFRLIVNQGRVWAEDTKY